MVNNIFKGTIYVSGEKELQAFQTAALLCGYCISIFPLGKEEYRMEIFTPEVNAHGKESGGQQ